MRLFFYVEIYIDLDDSSSLTFNLYKYMGHNATRY
jgi:hypothetical protein